MKTDQLNLGQLMRYGFCGFFLCLAFVYGKEGHTELDRLFSKKESSEALLAAAFFASGAVFYSFYRALLYPLLGLIALFAVYYRSLWKENDQKNISIEDRKIREWTLVVTLLRFTPMIQMAVILVWFKSWRYELSIDECVWAAALTLIYVGVLAVWHKCRGFKHIRAWLKKNSKGHTTFCAGIKKTCKELKELLELTLRYIFTAKISERELKLDKERWDSKQNQTGAQHLEEWASQIHLLYTTAFAITFGSAIGAVWSCLPTHDLWNIRCSIPGMFVVQLLLFAAFASDCRRRRFEDYLRRKPLKAPDIKSSATS